MIQGAAGSVTKYAAILFREWTLKENIQDQVFISNLVHDEINVECKEDLVDLVSINLERCMENSGSLWCKIVPLKAKAVITTYWGH